MFFPYPLDLCLLKVFYSHHIHIGIIPAVPELPVGTVKCKDVRYTIGKHEPAIRLDLGPGVQKYLPPLS